MGGLPLREQIDEGNYLNRIPLICNVKFVQKDKDARKKPQIKMDLAKITKKNR